jgi:hypothetical protein
VIEEFVFVFLPNHCLFTFKVLLLTDFQILLMAEMAGNFKPGGGPRRSKSHRKSRKGKTHKKIHLTQDDIDFLKSNTKYDEGEIREWYKGFKVNKNEQNGRRVFKNMQSCHVSRWTALMDNWARTRSWTCTP